MDDLPEGFQIDEVSYESPPVIVGTLEGPVKRDRVYIIKNLTTIPLLFDRKERFMKMAHFPSK